MMKNLSRLSLVLSGMLCASAWANQITVYASTNVWGSVAEAIGGKQVTVVTGIEKSDQDPHDYEASAHDKLNVSKAALAIVNGGGYDDWALQLVNSVKNPPKLLNAVEISGLKPKGQDEFNEHVFYSLPSVKKVAHAIAVALSEKYPKDKALFTAREKTFAKQIDQLEKEAAQIGAGKHLKAVFTEPVVGYLLESMNIENITPEEYVEQSETEAGPSAKALLDTVNLLKDKKASLLVLNAQTEDGASDALNRAAVAAKIPVVRVYETFPNGVKSYVQFIQQALNAFKAAVH